MTGVKEASRRPLVRAASMIAGILMFAVGLGILIVRYDVYRVTTGVMAPSLHIGEIALVLQQACR